MTNLEKWMYFTKDFESPQLFLEWGFFGLISAALQRRVWFESDPVSKLPNVNSKFLNQFIILIGPRACGKSRVLKNVKAICEHEKNRRIIADRKTGKTVLNLPAITCTPDNITFEGLFQFMSRPDMIDGSVMKTTDHEGKEIEVLYSHNSATACIEELGVLFTKNTEDVASVLCQAYDAGNLFRWTKTQGKDEIKNVCVNFVAGTTPDAIRRLMANQIVEEGFASRAIFVYAGSPRFQRFDSTITASQQLAMNALTQHVNNLATKVLGECRLTSEAYDYMKSYYESGKMLQDGRLNHDTKLDGYYGRKKMHWFKLSALVHFADRVDTMVIGLDSVMTALALLDKTEAEMHLSFRTVGINEKAEVGKDVCAYLRTNGETSYKKLFLTFYKDSKNGKQDFDEILNYLEVTDQVYKNGAGYKALEKLA